MPAGRESPFTLEQREVIRSYYPAWRDILQRYDPHFSPNNNLHTSDWRNKTASQIMKHSAFVDKMGDKNTIPRWEKKIRGCFTTERTRLKRAQIDDVGKAGMKDLPHNPKACSEGLRELSKALVSMRSLETDARAVFREQNDQAIRLRARELEMTPFGAAFQVALKELWAAADHDEWEEKAREAVDVYSNQKEFGQMIYEALKALCQLGHLGRPEMVLLYAFRDENDELTTHAVHTHSLSNVAGLTFDLGATKHAFANFCQAAISPSTCTEVCTAKVARSMSLEKQVVTPAPNSPEKHDHEQSYPEKIHDVTLTQSTLTQSFRVQKQDDMEQDAPPRWHCSGSLSSSSEIRAVSGTNSGAPSAVSADTLHVEEAAAKAVLAVEENGDTPKVTNIINEDTVMKTPPQSPLTQTSESPTTIAKELPCASSTEAPKKRKRNTTPVSRQPRTSTRAKGDDLKLLRESEKVVKDKKAGKAWSGPGGKGYWTIAEDAESVSDDKDINEAATRRVRRKKA